MFACGTGVVLYVVQKLLTCTEEFPKNSNKGNLSKIRVHPELGYLTLAESAHVASLVPRLTSDTFWGLWRESLVHIVCACAKSPRKSGAIGYCRLTSVTQ